MPEYLTKEEIKQWRSSLEKITFEEFAKRLGKEVQKTKEEIKLDSMNSYERRIIHNALNNWNNIMTESIGEEPNRCVVIKYKGDK